MDTSSERSADQPSGPVSAQELSAALDGRNLSVRGSTWRIEAFGVWDAQGQRWVQLALKAIEHGRDHVLTLKLSPGAGAQHALMMLTSWLADPREDASDVLNVA